MSGDNLMEKYPLFPVEDGGSNPTSPLQLFFRPISSQTMNTVVVENHYTHRPVTSTWAFGAYWGDILLGVISFGKSAAPEPNMVCGKNNASRVYELNRLWMDKRCPKNSESRFIGWSLRQLKKISPSLIIISYADTKENHRGTIYAASNWTYCGLTDEGRMLRGDRTIIENGKHSRHHKNLSNPIIRRSRKHRFVYFCDYRDASALRWKVVKWNVAAIGRAILALSLIILASCASPPPSESGCEWAYTAASLGDCRDKTIFCDDLGAAVILCDGYELDTGAPCVNADNYPMPDYEGCMGTINQAFGLESAGDE